MSHVVVPTEQCRYPDAPCGENYNDPTPCHGCLGNGRRAVLREAADVELKAEQYERVDGRVCEVRKWWEVVS